MPPCSRIELRCWGRTLESRVATLRHQLDSNAGPPAEPRATQKVDCIRRLLSLDCVADSIHSRSPNGCSGLNRWPDDRRAVLDQLRHRSAGVHRLAGARRCVCHRRLRCRSGRRTDDCAPRPAEATLALNHRAPSRPRRADAAWPISSSPPRPSRSQRAVA